MKFNLNVLLQTVKQFYRNRFRNVFSCIGEKRFARIAKCDNRLIKTSVRFHATDDGNLLKILIYFAQLM